MVSRKHSKPCVSSNLFAVISHGGKLEAWDHDTWLATGEVGASILRGHR